MIKGVNYLSSIARTYWQLRATVAALSMIRFIIPITQFSPNWANVFLKTNFLKVVNFECLEMKLIP